MTARRYTAQRRSANQRPATTHRRAGGREIPLAVASERPSVARLFAGAQVFGSLTAVDLREMAKFTETPNVLGLPMHPIFSPPEDDPVREHPGRLDSLPSALRAEIAGYLRDEAHLRVRGYLGGGSASPVRIAAYAPQSAAHLAAAYDAVFWPSREEHARPSEPPADSAPPANSVDPAAPAPSEPVAKTAIRSASPDITIIHLPLFGERLIASLPEEGLILLLGLDDIRPALLIALELANRLWTARTERAQEAASKAGAGAMASCSVLLPGGSIVCTAPSTDVNADSSADADARAGGPGADGVTTLCFAGESLPGSWEEMLAGGVPELADQNDASLRLAGAEPWVARDGGTVSPLWFNPPMPASLLAASPGWKTAAEHHAALPLGVAVGPGGEVLLAQSPAEAFVIVPRVAIPSPFMRTAAPRKADRLLTHRAVNPEAMELFGIGFAHPEVINPE